MTEDIRTVYQELLAKRIIFLRTAIHGPVASDVIAQLLYLEAINNKDNITLYINSPGGIITDGLAIYDVIQSINSPVSTLCMGQASSMAAILLASGKKGERYALQNSKIMIHQPSIYPTGGNESELKITAEQLTSDRGRLEDIIALHTGQTKERVHQDCDKNFYMNALEAKAYGLIDEILIKLP